MSPSDGMRAELNTLRAERDELLKALRPFARTLVLSIKFLPDSLYSTGQFIDGPSSEDFDLARQAIQNAEGK